MLHFNHLHSYLCILRQVSNHVAAHVLVGYLQGFHAPSKLLKFLKYTQHFVLGLKLQWQRSWLENSNSSLALCYCQMCSMSQLSPLAVNGHWFYFSLGKLYPVCSYICGKMLCMEYVVCTFMEVHTQYLKIYKVEVFWL